LNKNPLHQIEITIQDLRSPKRAHTVWGFLVVVALAFALMWPGHHTWLVNPNAYMFGESVDGFKNYMTAAWHVAHDSTYVLYRGMNYPYGEHAMFTDMQPIFCTGMQWWNANVSDISHQTVGIMNMFLLFSMLFGAGVLFLLFRKLHLPVWYAGIVALGVLFLSPQYNRFDGHFGLSHTWVLPLLLLLLCQYEERYSRRYQSLLIGFLLWFAAQLHFYYFGISALFLILYTGYQMLADRSWRNFRLRLSHLVVMILLPFAVLNIWMHWANYTADRPANPYGFTTYIAYLEGIFLPYENFPLFKWIDSQIIQIRRVNGESQAYEGIVAFLFTLWLLRSRFRMFGKSWDEMAYHRVHKRFLYGILAAASALLIFSFGFPFAIKGMEWTIEYLGPLKQFRGLGRFTWIYYYVINLIAFYVIWNYSLRFKGFKDGKYPWFRWVIALAPVAILVYEAYTFQSLKKLSLSDNTIQRNIAAPTPDHWLNKVDFTKFQALMPLPYNHIGSENIWMDIDFYLFRKIYTTAFHTGVPDMGVNMSRTPLKQMVKSVQFSLEPCETPAILEDMPDNRPIALMIEPHRWEDVQKKYRYLLEKATPVYDGPEMRIMSLQLDSIRSVQRNLANSVKAQMEKDGKYDLSGGWKSNVPPRWMYYQSYDSLTSTPHIFQGKGAGECRFRDTCWLYKNRIPKGNYNLSVWVKVDQDMPMTEELKIVEKNRADGHEIHFMHEGLRFHLVTIVNNWALFDVAFEVFDDNSNTYIFMPPKYLRGTYFYDELLIKRNELDVFRKVPGWVIRNNFWYKLPPEQ
jgi:hypothetical protein